MPPGLLVDFNMHLVQFAILSAPAATPAVAVAIAPTVAALVAIAVAVAPTGIDLGFVREFHHWERLGYGH